MSTTKVIGIGSPFGADQLGWIVVDEIASSFIKCHIQPTNITFEKADRPGIRLLDMMKGMRTVILIDAIDNKLSAGKIIKLEKSQILTSNQNLSSHHIGIAETLCLGARLDELPANIHLFGICVDVTNPALPDHSTIHELAEHVISTLNGMAQTNVHVGTLQ